MYDKARSYVKVVLFCFPNSEVYVEYNLNHDVHVYATFIFPNIIELMTTSSPLPLK